ncbi:MAG: 3-hydroxyacyl-CoA dehydrogenase family protein, partial [Chloroflexota bacterium]|nr:3-hydroxyacyl-CoA dehydrogenase family protein [Chloroflexota bacterium]
GLHRVTAVLQNLQDYYGEERYRAAPLLRKLVLQGRMGLEYGAGFYSYIEESNGTD